MDLSIPLENIGLTEKESKIYLALLELKEALPSTISRRSGIKRPTTYVILEELKRRGLASHVKKGKFSYFQPLNPHSLIENQYHRYRELEQALPELLSLHRKYAVTPQMTVFEGKQGLIQVMEDTLTARTTKNLLVWADIDLAVRTFGEYYPLYIRKKVERGLWVRGIFCYNQEGIRFKERGSKELREVYLTPSDLFPFKNEINIYDDKVAIISHEDEIGVIIKNQNIADTQRSIWQMCFEYAKLLEAKHYPALKNPIPEKDRLQFHSPKTMESF